MDSNFNENLKTRRQSPFKLRKGQWTDIGQA